MDVNTVPPFDWSTSEKDWPVFTTEEMLAGVKIKLTAYFISEVGTPGKTAGFDPLHLSDNMYEPGAVYFKWIGVPLQLQGKDESLYTSLDSKLFEISVFEAYKIETDSRGTDMGIIVITLRLKHA